MVTTFRSRSISETVSDINAGETTVDELVLKSRHEIHRYEPRLKAWVELTEVSAELEAHSSVASNSPLQGVSLGVKDIIDVRGLPTRCGSITADTTIHDTDADCVRRLRELGAVVQGKTVTTEYGYFAPGPTTNPYSAEHTPGGSSSGSAAAVGAGTIQCALGTQTAGSLTRPASFCGVAGLVLTHGSTSLRGVHGMSESLDSLGLMARSVEDLDYIYRHFSRRVEEQSVDPKSLNIYIWDGSGLLNLDPAMSELLRAVKRILFERDIHLHRMNWDDHVRSLVDDHKVVMSYEAAHSLGALLKEKKKQLSPQLQQLLEEGDTVTEQSYNEALFRKEASYHAFSKLFNGNSVIIGPASHGQAPRFEDGTGSPELSRPWQLLGLPVVTVPGALTSTGLPLGIQLIGNKHNELTLLRLGNFLEPLLRELPSFSNTQTTSTLKEMKW
ncbi:amidase [Corynebacterium suranareeae]|uniref:amidase n=1 Tax=Corynebacterium suranareeae TaxID=2506452 RepID=A0A169S239_9CORY|nr:amidase [Corynebacterium suranareeae]BAU96752.1 amidase [Corynebacterium suranareeae]